MQLQIIISDILLGVGILATLAGTIGMFKFKNFYTRLLVSSKIDTVGIILMILALIVRFGFSFFSGKLLLVLIILLIVNPLSGHIVAKSAYNAGHKLEEVEVQEDDL